MTRRWSDPAHWPSIVSGARHKRPASRSPGRALLRFGVLLSAPLGALFFCAPNVEPWLRRPKERAVLWIGLESYASRKDTLARLPPWDRREEKEHQGLSRGCGAREIRYRVFLLSLWGVRHHDQTGKLILTFLNDRLVRTEFRPIRGALYLERLISETPLSLPSSGRSRRMRLRGAPRHTEVLVEGAGDAIRVTWSDERLLKAYWEVQSRGSSRYVR